MKFDLSDPQFEQWYGCQCRISNVRKRIDGRDRTRWLYKHSKRACAESQLWKKINPCHTGVDSECAAFLVPGSVTELSWPHICFTRSPQ